MEKTSEGYILEESSGFIPDDDLYLHGNYYTCLECRASYRSVDTLRNHMRAAHQEPFNGGADTVI